MIFLKSKFKLFLVLLIFLFIIFPLKSLAEGNEREKLGIFYSYENVSYYLESGRNDFDGLWDNFISTFDKTYLSPQFICNVNRYTRAEDYKLILFPLVANLSEEDELFFEDFLIHGGKLIISAGRIPPSDRMKAFLARHGFNIISTIQNEEILELAYRSDDENIKLNIGDIYLNYNLAPHSKSYLKWKSINKYACSGNKELILIGYPWGCTNNKNDPGVLVSTIDYFWEGVISRFEKEITKEEFSKSFEELLSMKEKAISIIQIADEIGVKVSEEDLQYHLNEGVQDLKDYTSLYLFGKFILARKKLIEAKEHFAILTSIGLPARDVEVRAIWLDRGTIVNCRGPEDLKRVIRNIARLGFNVIFFETLNAGFPIYPSMLLPQNPMVEGWDPLKVAVKEAHLHNIEIHAWVWTFAVGNTRHNIILGKDPRFLGPILSIKGEEWGLRSFDGSLRDEDQTEYWISPANTEAREFLLNLFKEIITTYDVNGLQLDYIRFPFQDANYQVGFDDITKNSYMKETGNDLNPESIHDKSFINWKTQKVSSFVYDVSRTLKDINKNLKLTVAVFAIPRHKRIEIIQQDWETWAENKWIDAACPFYYSFPPRAIEEKITQSKKDIKNNSFIIPGFNLRTISEGELAERVISARESGGLGVALFAYTHLNKEKNDLLLQGPFKEKAEYIPYNEPLESTKKLFSEFKFLIDSFTGTNYTSVLSDAKTSVEVKLLSEEISKELENISPEKINYIGERLNELNLKIDDWLRLEKYTGRNERTIYIKSYLEQTISTFQYFKSRHFLP